LVGYRGVRSFLPEDYESVSPGDNVTYYFGSAGHAAVVMDGNDQLDCNATTSSIDSCSWNDTFCDLSARVAAGVGTSWTYTVGFGDLGKTFQVFCPFHCDLNMSYFFTVVNRSICDRYSTLLDVTNYDLIYAIVNTTFVSLVGNSTTRPYFTGHIPYHSTDFLDRVNHQNLVNLVSGLVEFFGTALGCNDLSIPQYNGFDLWTIHRNMEVTDQAFDAFVEQLVGVCRNFGVYNVDLDAITSYLNSQRSGIVNGLLQHDDFLQPRTYDGLIISVSLCALGVALLVGVFCAGLTFAEESWRKMIFT